MTDSPLKPHFFESENESPDALFYAHARMVVHIRDYAASACALVTTSMSRRAGSRHAMATAR